MNAGLKKVLDTFSTDKAFEEKMSKCKTPQEAYEAAKTVADGYTLEEFQDVMTKLYNLASGSENDEISEEDLQAVSGGMSDGEIAGLVVSSVGTAASLASLAG